MWRLPDTHDNEMEKGRQAGGGRARGGMLATQQCPWLPEEEDNPAPLGWAALLGQAGPGGLKSQGVSFSISSFFLFLLVCFALGIK